MLRAEQVDYRQLFAALCHQLGRFDVRLSPADMRFGERRPVEVHDYQDGSAAAWINEDWPVVSGTDIGKGM